MAVIKSLGSMRFLIGCNVGNREQEQKNKERKSEKKRIESER